MSKNTFNDILKGMSDEERKTVNARIQSVGAENRKLRKTVENQSHQLSMTRRKVTYGSPALAITEPVKTSSGKSVTVEVEQILNSSEYKELKPLMGPLIEVTTRILQGSDLSRQIPLKVIGDDGKPTSEDMLDSSGKPMFAPSAVSQVKEFYSYLTSDPEFQDSIRSIQSIIDRYEPSFKSKAPSLKGVVDRYQGQSVLEKIEEMAAQAKGSEKSTDSSFSL